MWHAKVCGGLEASDINVLTQREDEWTEIFWRRAAMDLVGTAGSWPEGAVKQETVREAQQATLSTAEAYLTDMALLLAGDCSATSLKETDRAFATCFSAFGACCRMYHATNDPPTR